MRTRREMFPLFASFAVACGAVSLTGLTGCGGGDTHTANIQAGDMPTGESWTGVYFHPVYGYLHMVQNENNVVGKWKRADQSAWGELSGVATGNVLHFEWKEHKYGMVGPSAESKGKGYFVYKPGAEKIPELDGQFGIGDEETGADWHNIKQVRMNPDLNSIKGDSTAAPAAVTKGGGWQ
jgi:hypothetical protein